MSEESQANLGSMAALLADARNRIIEAETRCNNLIEKEVDRLQVSMGEMSQQLVSLNLDLQKWNPLLTQLQKADENKKNLSLLLMASFLTNICTIIVTVFIFFIKSGAIK
jgi:hypothetical protein